MGCIKNLWCWRQIIVGSSMSILYSKAIVRIDREMSEGFEINVGLRWGCVMSPWLFSV